MAGGKRYKFEGSTIAVLTGYVGGSPMADITGITAANPAVVTSNAHGLSDGDVVAITEVLGMTEINGTSYIADVINANTFSLRDTNSTAYTAYASGGKFNKATFSNFCELTSYNRTGGSSPIIPADSLCSTFQEFEVGLPGAGTTAVGYNFAPQTAIQVALAAFDLSKALMGVKIVLPNSGGSRVQLGFVQTLSEQVARGGLWTGNLTIQNTGGPFDFA